MSNLNPAFHDLSFSMSFMQNTGHKYPRKMQTHKTSIRPTIARSHGAGLLIDVSAYVAKLVENKHKSIRSTGQF